MQVLAAGDEAPSQPIPGFPMTWPHAEAVGGWGGDRLNMYENGEQWIIDWQTAWDTQSDADEFATRVNELSTRFQGITRISTTPQGVRVQVGSDQSVLDFPTTL
jgi:hypothetical protein